MKENKYDIYHGDCINEIEKLSDESIDLVYLDPPFFTKKIHQLSNRDRTKQYSFSDLWKSQSEYYDFLFPRLQLLYKKLKKIGSLYFHCDTNSNYIARMVLNEIFGENNFRSEIIWTYKRWSNSTNNYLPSYQNILFYTKSDNYTFNKIYQNYSSTTNLDQILQERMRDNSGKAIYKKDINGKVVTNGNKKGVPLSDVWEIPFLNPKAKERVGYPTQKPILLLERIIEISSNKNDLILDPFCGSGTTLVASKILGRNAIGIDISIDAVNLSKERLRNPIKSDSDLLNKGKDSYDSNKSQIFSILYGLKFHEVHRNSGIDFMLKSPLGDKPILVKVQKEDEDYLEAATKLIKSATNKNAALIILIKTSNRKELINTNTLLIKPNNFIELNSVALNIELEISNLLSRESKIGVQQSV